MGHGHVRAEKICLNCSTEVLGRYCHECGQENVEPKETTLHLARHVFEDITHFDGKFFSSIKYLVTRPGYLTMKYMQGKRVSFLNPVRMYLFTSAIFFVLLFSFIIKPAHFDPVTAHIRDTVEQRSISTGFGFESKPIPGVDGQVLLLHFDRQYAVNGGHVYDSIQHSLPAKERDGLFRSYFDRKMAIAATNYHREPNRFVQKMADKFFHSISTIFFVSLPFFALMLQLLYIRRKEYYFVAHAVFSIHFYCVVFLFTLVFASMVKLSATMPDSDLIFWLAMASCLIFPGIFFYLYIAMKRFYKQGWLKTLVKFSMQSFGFMLLLFFLTAFFFISSMTVEI